VFNICFNGGLCDGEAVGIARSLHGRLFMPHGDGGPLGDTEWVALGGGLSINQHQKLPVVTCDSITGQPARNRANPRELEGLSTRVKGRFIAAARRAVPGNDVDTP
jgi:hypothetical protein